MCCNRDRGEKLRFGGIGKCLIGYEVVQRHWGGFRVYFIGRERGGFALFGRGVTHWKGRSLVC